ncbi:MULTISPECIES: nucleotide exchange factor GrpE [Aurantimicrobium]|jgi:molecular chaperone GrpE|uniref:Protein GrpE n=1 Tax=Aurantimicrobium photophilum TaxID=1987356 RepID=A0A2Z3S252_9MICO|nr:MULTISPECIES: nucleotide exchange factor GrpE [Aurantimicrobium]AWR22286.1 heat shock protein GrpE [Aurantimicrobium photophilum]MDF9809403.1 molecular chaperone GrpE [Aurantimicrobium minutum]
MSDQNSNPVEEPLNGGSSAGDSNAAGENAGFVEDPGYDNAEGISLEDADVETSLTDADLSFLEEAESDLAAERLADLQRVTAEYANYRKRTEANREIERERIISDTVKILLPVLDDIDRAEKHGDLTEGSALAAIAGKLRGVTERLGLVAYGAAGDVFDPNQHEAILQQPTPGATAETVLDVVETGYMLGLTQVRAAKVVVAVPAD